MTCEPCSAEERRRAPSKGQDVEMEEKGSVHVKCPPGYEPLVVTLWQCPKCKDCRLESEVQ